MPPEQELPPDLARSVAACAAAHRRLVTRVEGWAPVGDPGAPSRLPDWTIGHLLTHLARNADSLIGMLEAAARGEVAAQYPGGVAAREADIEAGAARSARALTADVSATAAGLDAAFATSPFAGRGRTIAAGEIPVAELPWRRRREVEIHLVDLGLGDEPSDWPADFVRPELRRLEMTAKSRMPMGLTTWPPAVTALSDQDRLAWLLGRLTGEGLPDPGPWS